MKRRSRGSRRSLADVCELKYSQEVSYFSFPFLFLLYGSDVLTTTIPKAYDREETFFSCSLLLQIVRALRETYIIRVIVLSTNQF